MNPDIFSHIISYLDIDKVHNLLSVVGHHYYPSVRYVYENMYMKMASRILMTWNGDCTGNAEWYIEHTIRYYTYGKVAIPLVVLYREWYYEFEYEENDTSIREVYYMNDITHRVDTYIKELITMIRNQGYRISYL
jgi:hypothetical protein